MKSRKGVPYIVVVALAVLWSVTLGPCARADDFAYLLTGGQHQFGILDLTTGVFTQIGNPLGVAVGTGLGELGGNLYTIDGNSSTLYQVTTNGVLIAGPSGSAIYDNIGSTTAGLFALDYSYNLYSINPATGAATLIGPTGVNLAGNTGNGLSAGSTTLYWASTYLTDQRSKG